MLRPLVLIHDADWTGASVALLRIVRRLAEDHGVEPAFLSRHEGPLLAEFERIAPVELVPRRAKRLLRRLAGRADVVYANTLTHGAVLRELPSGPPVVTHVHELAGGAEAFTTPDDLRVVVARTERWIAVSKTVREFVRTELRAQPTGVHLIREPLDMGDFDDVRPDRSVLEVVDGSPVVGVVGTVDGRKGVDLLLAVAERLPEVTFRWIGGGDVALGTPPNVRFLGTLAPPFAAMAAFDVLLLPSREDPYPLVVLEAAALGVPAICFAEAGGAPEFVRDDAGVVVPYGNTAAMAAAVAELLADRPRRRALGAVARTRAAEHDSAVIAAEVMAVLE